MSLPEPKPLSDHLSEWSRSDLAQAGDAVEGLMQSAGWEAIERSIEDRLRFEQRILMVNPPMGDDPKYERTLGQWAGLRTVRAIAEGIVAAGKQAEREMREAA